MGATTMTTATDLPREMPRSARGLRTRASLVQAAKEIFEEQGFFDARISDITKRAGVSHGTFYTYFDSKEQVFREVALEVEEQLSSPIGEVILSVGSRATPEERIREAIRRYLESYRREAKIMGVIEQVSRHDEALHSARLEWQAHYEEMVRKSGQPLSPCVEIDGVMLADVSHSVISEQIVSEA